MIDRQRRTWSQNNQHLHSDDWQRTIYINTKDVKTTEFDLSDVQKNTLVESGENGATDYFIWFDNPEESPKNRIS